MPIYKWLFVVVFVTINSHFLFSQCNENIFDSFEMSEIEFDDWENKNKKTKKLIWRRKVIQTNSKETRKYR